MDSDFPSFADVVIVGGGNAGLCAALAARETGASVLVVERAPLETRGGNSRFTGGAMRVPYTSDADLAELVDGLSAESDGLDFGVYTPQMFLADLARVTEYRCDPELASILVEQSFDTLRWMRANGVRFLPALGRQAFKAGERTRFWGGLVLETSGGGEGLVDALFSRADRVGVAVAYDTRALDLELDDDAVVGLWCRHGGRRQLVRAASVVLAAGGFQANAEWRTRYLGPGWDLAKVRGTRFNTGDGIRMALDVGAMPFGQWSGCHAVAWDRNAPDFGDLRVGESYQKHSYPFGVVVNSDGHRFLDEGADFRNYTYAKYGKVILAQRGQVAWQVFDAKVTHLLRDEYRIRQVTRVTADTLEGLAAKMEGVEAAGFLGEIDEYNRSVRSDVDFDPTALDGRRGSSSGVPRTNWANTLDTPPYEAYQVTCGITFTFGGVKIDSDSRVLDEGERPIPGLYAAGELVGGLFYFNYPGGTGLTSGAVFGRIAGRCAGVRSVRRRGSGADREDAGV